LFFFSKKRLALLDYRTRWAFNHADLRVPRHKRFRPTFIPKLVRRREVPKSLTRFPFRAIKWSFIFGSFDAFGPFMSSYERHYMGTGFFMGMAMSWASRVSRTTKFRRGKRKVRLRHRFIRKFARSIRSGVFLAGLEMAFFSFIKMFGGGRKGPFTPMGIYKKEPAFPRKYIEFDKNLDPAVRLWSEEKAKLAVKNQQFKQLEQNRIKEVENYAKKKSIDKLD